MMDDLSCGRVESCRLPRQSVTAVRAAGPRLILRAALLVVARRLGLAVEAGLGSVERHHAATTPLRLLPEVLDSRELLAILRVGAVDISPPPLQSDAEAVEDAPDAGERKQLHPLERLLEE